MMRLWIRCQQGFDLSPFELQIWDGPASLRDSSSSSGRPPQQLQKSVVSAPISPTQVIDTQESATRGAALESTATAASRTKRNSSQTTAKPALTRTASGNEPGRKRSSITAPSTRGKSRPSVTRKRSSQSTQPSDNSRPRRLTVKSPRSSAADAEALDSKQNLRPSIADRISQSPGATNFPSRKISVFELPSASSWQSVDSHTDPFASTSKKASEEDPQPLQIDKNFRERFNENQKQLRSSTNLAGMHRTMRKTGSVVRFADEVNVPESLRKLKGIAADAPAASMSDERSPASPEQAQSWRQALSHRGSIGSVAAVSDEGSDELDPELPRIKSHLSLAIANLKRSQSSGEVGSLHDAGVTSPEIEMEQEALISGAHTKKKSEEEEKLLAMAHKDGVTKAGGINMPKELTIKGTAFELGSSYDSPEEPLY